MSDAHPLQPGLSLFFSLGSQSITLRIGTHPLQPGLSLFFSFYGHSLTMSDAHPLQPDLSLFFSLRCPSFPSLLLGCRSILRSHLAARLALSLILPAFSIFLPFVLLSLKPYELSLSFSSTEKPVGSDPSLQIQILSSLNPYSSILLQIDTWQ